MSFERIFEKNRRLIVAFIIALIILYAYNMGYLQKIMSIVPGPEGVSASAYSAVSFGNINVNGKSDSLTQNVGTQSIIGQAQPNDWIAYKDYTETDIWGNQYPKRIGYRWLRTDPATPIIEAVIIDRKTGQVLEGINIQIRISKPTFEEINKHGDPLGRNPTQIDWYSFEGGKVEQGDKVYLKHYEVYIVPVDFVIELSIRPVSSNLDVGDFQRFDIWFVIDTVVWLNAFTQNQYALLRDNPQARNATVTAYNFRGGFPIWAWIGAWSPWQVSGKDGNPDKFYDPSEIPPEDRTKLEQHLQLMPSYGGSEVSLYTQPGYVYTRLFSADIIKNPDLLKQMIQSSLNGLPDPRFATTVYFPLTLINYGALKVEWYSWGIFYGHKEYYPTSYMRVRCLYAIYGEWVYMWTKQQAQQQNYQWENRSSTITGDKDLWMKFQEAFIGWLSSPWTMLGISLFTLALIAIALIALAIFVPGFISALLNRRRRD
jgi:hypothetical protein